MKVDTQWRKWIGWWGMLAGILASGACRSAMPVIGQQVRGFQRQGDRLIVPSDGNLQAAIDDAKPGETIAVAAGAVFRGTFVLSPKSGGDALITIESSDLSLVPEANIRIARDAARTLPKIVAEKGPAIVVRAGAHHIR